jgi:hypothetical protein
MSNFYRAIRRAFRACISEYKRTRRQQRETRLRLRSAVDTEDF